MPWSSPAAWRRSPALLLTLLRPGDTVSLPADGYFPDAGVRHRRPAGTCASGTCPTAGPYPSFDGVRLVLLETPANPGLDVCDIAALAAAAHAAGALVAVDNTTATPLGQRPLDLGADLVVASGTKALTGHSDLLLGYAAPATRSCWRAWRPGGPAPARCPARSTPGWRTARWPPWTCGWPGSPRTPPPSRSCSPAART